MGAREDPTFEEICEPGRREWSENSPLQKHLKIMYFDMKWLQKIQFGAWRPGYGSKFRCGCIGDSPTSFLIQK